MRTWLREVRTMRQMSAEQVAEALDISVGGYCMIERGERQKNTMYIKTAVKLSQILSVPMEDIIKWEMQ